MIGAYISDDFYFFLSGIEYISGTYFGKFVCPSNTEEDKYILMSLVVSIDNGNAIRPPSSSIDINYRKKVCSLTFSQKDFEEWFISPTEHIKEVGPNWRFASSNVYIRTDNSKDPDIFRNNIISFMSRAPEPPRPNYAKIRSFKKKEKSRKNNAG